MNGYKRGYRHTNIMFLYICDIPTLYNHQAVNWPCRIFNTGVSFILRKQGDLKHVMYLENITKIVGWAPNIEILLFFFFKCLFQSEFPRTG